MWIRRAFYPMALMCSCLCCFLWVMSIERPFAPWYLFAFTFLLLADGLIAVDPVLLFAENMQQTSVIPLHTITHTLPPICNYIFRIQLSIAFWHFSARKSNKFHSWGTCICLTIKAYWQRIGHLITIVKLVYTSFPLLLGWPSRERKPIQIGFRVCFSSGEIDHHLKSTSYAPANTLLCLFASKAL